MITHHQNKKNGFDWGIYTLILVNMIYDCVRLKRKISREKEEDEENKTYSIINQIIFIFLQFSSCIIYLLRELKMESTVAVSTSVYFMENSSGFTDRIRLE